jgi:D-lactate dehydrogenase
MDVAWFDYQNWEEIQKNYIQKFKNPLTTENCEDCGADVVSVFASSNVDEEVLESIRPEAVVTRSTGYDHIDLEKAEEMGIQVYNVPHYGSSTVAEHAFTLLLGAARHLPRAEEKTHHEFSHEGLEGFELKGKKIGIIGTGEIGQKAIKMAKGFEMDVIAYDKYESKELEEELGFMYVNFEDLIEKSDIISIHCPLTDENRHMLSEDEFNKMKGTVIINTARGELIDSEALLQALKKDDVKSAGLDVVEMEDEMEKRGDFSEKTDFCSKELEANCRLINREDVIVTPHTAFNTEEAKHRIIETTIQNIEERPEENRLV